MATDECHQVGTCSPATGTCSNPVRPDGAVCDEVCLADGIVGGFATDAEDPNPGDAFWYLIQGTNGCGRGPYGFQSMNGVPTAPRVGATCP